MTNQETIHHAILTLAGRCDGARTRDGAGFNSYDAPWGHESARRIELGDSIPQRTALRVLAKYRKQLADAGITLPAPEAVQAVPVSAPASAPAVPIGVTVSRVGKSLAIRFPYDPAMVEIARGLPGRRWDAASRCWSTPISALDAVLTAFPGARLDAGLIEEREQKLRADAEAEAGRAAQLAVDLQAYETIRESLHLYEHQDIGARWLIEQRAGIVADDMGLGKTREALAAARALGHRIIVVAPAGLRVNWLREAEAVDVQIEIYSWAKVPEAIEGDYTLIGDEAHYCFPGETIVTTDKGPMPIEMIVNERRLVSVASFDSARNVLSFKPVTEWLRFRRYTHLVQVTHEHGSFICTADHKIWTDRGYVEASTLTRDTQLYILPHAVRDTNKRDQYGAVLLTSMRDEGPHPSRNCASSSAATATLKDMRMVQADIQDSPERSSISPQALLFEPLLQLMESDAASKYSADGSLAICCASDHGEQAPGCRGTYASKQPNAQSADTGKDGAVTQRTDIPLAWREWTTDQTATRNCEGFRLANGIRHQNGSSRDEISILAHALQSGSCTCVNTTGNRDRRENTPNAALAFSRSSQGNRVGRSRVVSVEILEPRSRPGDAASAQHDRFVYCLEVQDNHNFFANGVLVSNCQNLKAQRTKRFLDLAKAARAVFLLTGTPIKNGRPANLFPLLVAARHDLAKDRTGYERRYCEARATKWSRWDVTGASHLDELHRKIADVVLRRMKSECLDLPEKTRILRKAELSAEAQQRYTTVLNEMQTEYRRRKAAGEIQEADTLVLMNHVRHAGSVAKVETATELAEEIIEQGGQVVLFTAFMESAESLAIALNAGKITGEQNAEQRQAAIDKFQAGELKAMVCTLGAGNVGITLTAAQTVILVDRPWTPGDAIQAEDRLHRIGQRNAVTAIWLQANGADEAIDALLEQKHERIELVLAGKRKTLRGLGSISDVAEAVLG